jgi:hypothetical protein
VDTEANVHVAVVAALASWGWRIRSVANTATKERGVDMIAELARQVFNVEVKGFPSATTPTATVPVRPSARARAVKPVTGTPKRS